MKKIAPNITNCFNVAGRLLILALPLLLNDFYLPLVPEGSVKLNLILDLLVYIFWQCSVIFLAYKAKWFSIPDLGIYFKNLNKQVLWGFVFTVTALFVSLLIFILEIQIQKKTGIVLSDNWYYSPNPNWNAWQAGIYAVYFSLSAGVLEELVYRGIVISQLKRISTNTLFLVLTSTFLFVAIHWSNGFIAWMEAAVFGSFWAYIFIRTGKLLPLILAHFLYDLCFVYDFQKYILGLFNF
jgi:membrane protease YdiL (CAAX protease family)